MNTSPPRGVRSQARIDLVHRAGQLLDGQVLGGINLRRQDHLLQARHGRRRAAGSREPPEMQRARRATSSRSGLTTCRSVGRRAASPVRSPSPPGGFRSAARRSRRSPRTAQRSNEQPGGGKREPEQGRGVLESEGAQRGIARYPQVTDRRHAPDGSLAARLPHGLAPTRCRPRAPRCPGPPGDGVLPTVIARGPGR